MSAKVILVGEGKLSAVVYSRLSTDFEVLTQNLTNLQAEGAGLVLLVQDKWNPSAYAEIQRRLRPLGIPWLNAFLSDSEGFIGPLARGNRPGCPKCADSRRLLSDRDHLSSGWGMLPFLKGKVDPGRADDDAGLRQLASLLWEDTMRVLKGRQALTEERMIMVDLKQLSISSHYILPDSVCDVCGSLSEDSPEAASISLQPRPKAHEDSYRSRSSSELEDVLVRDYLDQRTGLMNRKTVQHNTPFADVLVHLPLILGEEEVTAGRSLSYAGSERTAILEGLERFSGLFPRGKDIAVHDSYRNMEKQALHPALTGLYSKEQYEMPDFEFEPFDPDVPMDWVWGYSLLQQSPLLVPSALGYYSMGFAHDFVHETSNGCALGGSLEEAILFGILEVVERDSFLMTWYGMLPVPRLDPESSGDLELQVMIERVRAVSGYDIFLYNTTMENGIPSILALAKNRGKSGVNLLCGAGAHLDPVRAAKSAIHEISGMLPMLSDYFYKHRRSIVRMLHDSSRVKNMGDHALLYGLPQAESRLHFLLDGDRSTQTFAEGFKQRAKHKDLTEDLKDVLKIFKELNLDVIVVNQSSPETLKNGLHCVKVLIPGMLPMTFGYHLTRLTGLDRVLQVPALLGYAKHELRPEDLNPYPHPFP